jgi:hypothetical protein
VVVSACQLVKRICAVDRLTALLRNLLRPALRLLFACFTAASASRPRCCYGPFPSTARHHNLRRLTACPNDADGTPGNGMLGQSTSSRQKSANHDMKDRCTAEARWLRVSLMPKMIFPLPVDTARGRQGVLRVGSCVFWASAGLKAARLCRAIDPSCRGWRICAWNEILPLC